MLIQDRKNFRKLGYSQMLYLGLFLIGYACIMVYYAVGSFSGISL